MTQISKLQGVIAVDKPAGFTSNDIATYLRKYMSHVVKPKKYPMPTVEMDLIPLDSPAHSSKIKSNKRFQHRWPKEAKAGQAGTLDPMATGILVLGLGKGTKMLHYFLKGGIKTYLADGVFGKSTDTYDSSGTVVSEGQVPPEVTESSIIDCLEQKFTGKIMQRPPIYSALKVNGRKLCDIVRENERNGVSSDHLMPEPRETTIHEIKLTSFCPESHTFSISVSCSSGTYIRSIIHDLGIELDTFAHMTGLRRTAQGPFRVDQSEFDNDQNIPVLQVKDLTDFDKLQEFLSNENYEKIIDDYVKKVKLDVEIVENQDENEEHAAKKAKIE